jgi:hypothetical protein
MKIRVCRFAGLAMLLLLVAAVAKAQNCSNSITACGCTISAAGTYNVNADLTASQGLTSRKGCIDVNVSNVKLLTNGHNITGAGTGTGIGINLLVKQTIFLSAAGPQQTYTTISGWQYGLESQATNVIAEGFLFFRNTTGVLLKAAKNNNIGCFEADNNSVYGVWISGGSGNQIEYGEVWENPVAGLYIGCSATGPSGPACSGGGTSSGNYIFEVNSNPSGVPPQNYGIAVELGGTANGIMDNWFYGNSVDDLFDGNASGVNVWHANKFVTANQSFLQ